MAQSSDEIIKREIVDEFGTEINGLELWIFPETSNEDQNVFGNDGGLTFGISGKLYGSCDACWVKKEDWMNPYNDSVTSFTPIIALEGTDALNRGSSGNAQYQRFHHALGAVKAGIIGVYYLKKGVHKIQEDLYGMAYYASKKESGTYLIIDDLRELRDLLEIINDDDKIEDFLQNKLDHMHNIFLNKFKSTYGDWQTFAKKRSTILKSNYIIKHAGRMRRSFTDSSQRAGHIAVGEMFLTKYLFPDNFFFYLWPKMTSEDIEYLDEHKNEDKEWNLLRNENNVMIITIDDLEGVPTAVQSQLWTIKDEPLKGDVLRLYRKNVKLIVEGLQNNNIRIKSDILTELDLM